MSTVFITILVAVFGSNGLFLFIQFLITRKDSRFVTQKDIEPLNEAILATLQEKLESRMTEYLKIGKISVNQFKCLTNMLHAYEGLNGDGFIHELYDQCKDIIEE